MELLLRERNVVQYGIHLRQLEAGMAGVRSEDIRVSGSRSSDDCDE
jgi:hypothetical protein